ncbi:hypothetical protein AAG570_003655, partial [Ranatra chinensis]
FIEVCLQVVASCIALGTTIQSGICLSFSAVLIPQLTQEFSGFTKVEASWIASLSAIAIPLGALLVGPIMDAIGRRKTCTLACVPLFVSWIVTYTAPALWPIYLARVLMGFGAGLTTAAVVYTAEVSCVEFRPALLCLNSVTVALGILLTTVLGVQVHWRTACLCFAALAAINCALTLLTPESPYWLVHFTRPQRGFQEAKKAVGWLNRPPWLFQAEWKLLQDSYKSREAAPTVGLKSKLSDTLKMFTDRSCLAPLRILLIVFAFQQLSGVYIIIFYAVNIFQSIGGQFGASVDEYTATAAMGVIRFLMSTLTVFLARRLGRRVLMSVSSVGMALMCLSVAVAQYSAGNAAVDFLTGVTSGPTSTEVTRNEPHRWITLVSLLLFVCAAAVGHMAIPWVLMSEILPIKMRGIGNGLLVSYAYVLMFGVIKTFPYLLDSLGLATVFLGYGVIATACIFYIYFYLPETFGKSFAEIAKQFEK